jgi:transposase
MDEDRLRRHDLTGAEWARLEPLLPRNPRQGHRWNDHRLRAGCDEAEGAARTVAADATVVRAHQHAAGARRAPAG